MFLSFDSCFESTAPWFFICIIYTFDLAEGFLASTRVSSHQPLGVLVYSIHFDLGRRFLGFDSCFESTAPWLFVCIIYTFDLVEGFLASTRVSSRQPLGVLVYDIHLQINMYSLLRLRAVLT